MFCKFLLYFIFNILLILTFINCSTGHKKDISSNILTHHDQSEDSSSDFLTNQFKYQKYYPLFYSLVGSVLIGLTGIMPLLLINSSTSDFLRSSAGKASLNRWLSFAFGSIIGDVFLHLLPETLNSLENSSGHSAQMQVGLCVIAGFLIFFIIERIFVEKTVKEEIQFGKKTDDHKTGAKGDNDSVKIDKVIKQSEIQAEGYLNLLANFVDNFTHGMAVGGSFLISYKLGVLTTMCILVHEIPHEISDFVILLRAGFNPWRAAKWQLLTATGSLLGSVFAFSVDTATTGLSKAFILPMTSGAFLYIAMVSLLPPLLAEQQQRESLIQLSLVGLGVALMLVLSLNC